MKYLRFHVRMKRKFNREEKVTESQLYAMKILKRMIISPSTEMMIAPISGIHYMKWKDIFAKHGGDRVQIINGKYFYEINLTMKQSDDLHEFFNYRLEARRKMMEKEIVDKTARSLVTIYQEIQEETNQIR